MGLRAGAASSSARWVYAAGPRIRALWPIVRATTISTFACRASHTRPIATGTLAICLSASGLRAPDFEPATLDFVRVLKGPFLACLGPVDIFGVVQPGSVWKCRRK